MLVLFTTTPAALPARRRTAKQSYRQHWHRQEEAGTGVGEDEPGGEEAAAEDGEEAEEEAVERVPGLVLLGVVRVGVVAGPARTTTRPLLSPSFFAHPVCPPSGHLQEHQARERVDGAGGPNEADDGERAAGVEEGAVLEAPVEEDEAVW